MAVLDQQFRKVRDISEFDDIVEALESGSEPYVQTEISDFGCDTDFGDLEPESIVSNHYNYANGVRTEKTVAAIYGLGPANTPSNEPPDLISSPDDGFNGKKAGYEVKSCKIGRNTENGLRPGRYDIPLDSHERITSDESYTDIRYIMASRITSEDNQLASIAILSPEDIDMLVENTDLPGLRDFNKSRSGREFLGIEEPIANRVAKHYNHSIYPHTGEGYSRELEKDFRKSFDPETVEYWLEHPENSVKPQDKYFAN